MELINNKKLKLIFILTLIFSILIINTVYADDSIPLNYEDSLNEDLSLNTDPVEPISCENNLNKDLESNIYDEGDSDSFQSIQDLVDNANDGDSIYLSNKTYKSNGNPITINKTLKIYGVVKKGNNRVYLDDSDSIDFNSSKLLTILDGDSKSNIFIVSKNIHLDLIGLSLINGNSTNGGAIFNNGTLNIENSILNSNKAERGGAIYNQKTTSIQNSIVNYNKASMEGGVVYNDGELELNKVNSSSNEGQYGGVITNNRNTTIKDSSFNSNKASEAGVIYSYGDLSIANCEFAKQRVTHTSGVIFIRNGDVKISYSLFKSNIGADEGGVIFVYEGTASIKSSRFISNKATSYGAAIDNNGLMTIEDCEFDKNQAYGAGAIDNGGDLTILNSVFKNNRVSNNGGAIDSNGKLNIIGTILENNSAGNGGAIMSRWNTNISHSAFINNKASMGNDIYRTEGDLSINDNWWGLNNPKFEDSFNFNVSDSFKWIIMEFKNATPLVKGSNVDLIISLNKTKDENDDKYELDNPNLLPDLKAIVKISGDVDRNYEFHIINGSKLFSMKLKSDSLISATVNNQTLNLNIRDNGITEDNERNKVDENSSEKSRNASKSLNKTRNDKASNVKERDDKTNHSNEFDLNKNGASNKEQLSFNKSKKFINPINSLTSDKNSSLEKSGKIDQSDNRKLVNEKINNFDLNALLLIIPIALLLLILFAFKRKNDDEKGEN